MTVAALRVFIFSILPLLVGGVHSAVDKTVTSRERRSEVREEDYFQQLERLLIPLAELYERIEAGSGGAAVP